MDRVGLIAGATADANFEGVLPDHPRYRGSRRSPVKVQLNGRGAVLGSRVDGIGRVGGCCCILDHIRVKRRGQSARANPQRREARR